MLELLRPVARRIAPLRWLYRKRRAASAAPVAEPQSAFPPRLNFGCGYDKRAGYLNIDISPECQPDLLIRDRDYSAIPRDYFEEVYANDVLEHFPRTETLSVLLDWASWLKTGGTLSFQTSSIVGAVDRLRHGAKFSDHHAWTRCIFGNQAHEGDFHYTGFTELSLKVYLLAAELDLQETALRDGWLLSVRATKERAWDGYLAALVGQSDEIFVRETFRRAVDEDPSSDFQLQGYLDRLKSRSATRWQIAKEVFQSDHRLFVTAAKHSL